ncbi:MAG: hypothetical protein IK088_04435 [Lachnospiraceae bacterium]|nr:hypothetical protein [Lachnospiraceae bacterium]
MKENYVTDGKNCYLRLEAMYDSGYEFRMIRQNQPEMLLDFHPASSNEHALDYNVTGLTSLFALRESSVFEYLYPVLYAMERLGDVLRSYLLRPEGLVLTPETIFLQRETGQFYFCYVPGQVTPLKNNLMTLVEFFMKYAEPGSESDVLMLYGLYQKGRETTVTLSSLASFYRESHEKPETHKEPEPFMTEAPGAEEEAKIYSDLGLEPPPKKRVRFLPEFGRSAEKETVKLEKKPQPEIEPATADIKEEPLSFKEKLDRKIREHLFEVVVAGIVIAGAILFLTFWN